MFAKRRSVLLAGSEVARTPLLVPSFSSKGFPDVKQTVAACETFITESALFSAYDLDHRLVSLPSSLPGLLFLDSGGYECSKDDEFERLGFASQKPRAWNAKQHEKCAQRVIKRVTREGCVTAAVSFDHPKARRSLPAQIDAANGLFKRLHGVVREILLKAPAKAGDGVLDIDRVTPLVQDLTRFDVIAVTEKELGLSVFDRMRAIAKLRRALDHARLTTPIHVFGSLDTISTPLYFLAGADIFDGLTWLRYTYHEGFTCYAANTGVLRHSAEMSQSIVQVRSAIDNLNYLVDLTAQMKRYLNQKDFSEFRHNSDFIRRLVVNLFEEMKE
jgi:hypothetical protein